MLQSFGTVSSVSQAIYDSGQLVTVTSARMLSSIAQLEQAALYNNLSVWSSESPQHMTASWAL